MNTQKDNEDEGYDENDFIDNDDTVKNQVVAKKDKAAKAKRTKHKYIPRVWHSSDTVCPCISNSVILNQTAH